MVRIGALTLLMAVVAITGFTSVANAEDQGRAGPHNCNNCQVIALSEELVTRKKAMQCIRQSVKYTAKGFHFQGAKPSYEISKEKSTRAHVGKNYDVIKNVSFTGLSFYPDQDNGFVLADIPCNNGMVGFVTCKKCIEGGNH